MNDIRCASRERVKQIADDARRIVRDHRLSPEPVTAELSQAKAELRRRGEPA